MKRTLIVLALAAVVVTPAQAQFSSDLPGVPRARTGFLSSGQGRFELDVSAYKLPGATNDSIAGSFRIGFGKSWRIGSNAEVGYDVSLGELRGLRPAGDDPSTDFDATLAYGVRLGFKYQVFNVVDPDGYGLSAAVGAAYQPELQPVLMYSKREDGSVNGGYIGSAPEDGGINEVVAGSTTFMGAVSFRNERVDADGALILEQAKTPADGRLPRMMQVDGASLALGARLRVTSSIGVGFAYWGSGAAPWRDRLELGVREPDTSKFGLLLTFGSRLEKGTDIMISSPTGSFSESVSFYLRVH